MALEQATIPELLAELSAKFARMATGLPGAAVDVTSSGSDDGRPSAADGNVPVDDKQMDPPSDAPREGRG